MGKLSKEIEERVIVEGASVRVQTVTRIVEDGQVLSELPWAERTIGPDDDPGDDASDTVKELVKAARKNAKPRTEAEAARFAQVKQADREQRESRDRLRAAIAATPSAAERSAMELAEMEKR